MSSNFIPAHPEIPAKKTWGVVLLLVSLLPAFLLIPHIIGTWVSVPYWDDWQSPGQQLLHLAQGKLTLAELFSQQNASRPFFPRLVWIALDWFGWDVRKAMVAAFLMIAWASFLLQRLLAKSSETRAWERMLLYFLINGVLFWTNSQIWTFENTFMMVWPPAMLLCALNVNLSPASFRRKVIVNSVLAVVSTYSWANGMLVWLFALPLPAGIFSLHWFPRGQERRRVRWYLVYFAACTASLGFYFHDFEHTKLLLNLWLLMDYFLPWVGGFFGDLEHAKLIGTWICITFLALVGIYFPLAARRRDFKEGYPWVFLGFYSIASGVLTAIGRASAGAEQALSPRYVVMSGYLYIGIIGLCYCVWKLLRQDQRGKYAVVFAFGVLCGLLIPLTVGGYNRGVEFMEETAALRKTVLAAWQWSKVFPHNTGLSLLCKYSQNVEDDGTTLENAGILKIKRFSPDISKNWDFRPAGSVADGNHGCFDMCQLVPGPDMLVVQGWTRLPEQDRAADYVILTYSDVDGVPHPFLVIPGALRPRPDVASALNDRRMLDCGFLQDMKCKELPFGSFTVSAWAMDAKSWKIYLLAKTFVINRSKQ